MEEVRRRNSAIYASDLGHGSSTALREYEAPVAGSQFSGGNQGDAGGSNTGATTTEATKTAWYKQRKYIIAMIIAAALGIALLFILLFPVVKALVQLIVSKSSLDITVANITQPQNGSFALALQGNVAHTGKMAAKIQFPNPVNVSWIDDDKSETPIGYMALHDLHSSSHSRAEINDSTTFIISDQEAFGRFAQAMITRQNFTWKLSTNSLRVQALKFPVASGIHFTKEITLNGFNNFNNHVLLQDLKLPRDSPTGGIEYSATTQLSNTSPFAIDLGTVVFDLYYQQVFLGNGTGLNTKIVPGNNSITLDGVLQQQTDKHAIDALSNLFTNYLNGVTSPVMAIGKSTLQSDNTTISWLSQGLQALTLEVPFKSPTDIAPIKAISIGDMALTFNSSNPWAPSADSHTVQAQLELPFGFNLKILEIQNDFNITQNNQSVAGLSTPIGASTSDITVLSPTDTKGTINITIANTYLNVPPPSQSLFSLFNANLTSQRQTTFRLAGHSRAIAEMSIGNLTLDPIKVDVETGLKGLQGLQNMVSINTVDVTGGTSEGIQLAIDVSINNPSNLNLSTGDLTLHLLRDSAALGTALLPNLTLNMGANNNLTTKSIFAANDSPQGKQTLNEFVGRKDVALSIAGYDKSTEIASLLQAFKTLNIPITLPALKSNLLDSAALTVLPSTGIDNNISHVTVSLNNPWSAALQINKISSTVKYKSLTVGTITSDTQFTSHPNSTTQSPTLNLDMNFDPPTLFTLTRALAVEAGLDVAPLDGIVQLGGYQYLFTTGSSPSKEKRDNMYTGFNLPNFVQAAFKKLRSDVELTVDVTIGDYSTTLQYTQLNLPTKTDETLNLILPILARPIVQKIVDGSVLGIDNVLISNPQQNAFDAGLSGSITNAGPFDATIKFPSGLTVAWSGQPLGSINMKDVILTGDVGGNIQQTSSFHVESVGHLTDFTKTLLTDESFVWAISGENLTVSSLGIDIAEVVLSSKSVTLKGFNGLKGGVTIKTFDLPSNDPAGGIHLTLEATVTNPSQVGIKVSSLGFNTLARDSLIAVVSTGDVTLSPAATSTLALAGRLLPQSDTSGLEVISDVFNNFIHGKDSDIVVQGSSAGSSDVTWLNDGIRVLNVATTLPNRGVLNLIKTISLNQLQLMFTEDTSYNPATSSNSTDAAFTLPFAFPVDITSLEQTITVGFQGVSFAQLALPKAPTRTDVEQRIIHLTFDDVPFAVFGDQHSTFNDFVAATTTGGEQTLHLSGSADGDAKTAVGTLALKDIAFSVDSSIHGLEGLNAKPVTVSHLDVNHGFSDYLLIKVDSSIFNPSNLTIGTGDVSFSLQFNGQTVGSANLADLVIVPGGREYPTDVHYSPQGSAILAGQLLLENYIQGIDSSTVIAGTTSSTPIDSLKEALSEIELKPVVIPALHQPIVTSASLSFPIDIVRTGVAESSFTLSNPFTASINLLEVGATVTYHGLNLGRIDDVDVSSSPIHADGHSNVTSQTLPLHFNLDPLTIIQLLLISSKENNVNLGPLPGLFQFVVDNPDFHPPITTSVDTQKPTCVSGQQFDVNTAILDSLDNLKVDLAIDTSTKLDDFATDLTFNQTAVPSHVDETALYLIGAVASPITQNLVDNAILAFSEANITNLSDNGFDLSLKGSLTNVGPLDAMITFVEPVKVTWQGHDIATIELPPVCAAANSGVPDYKTNGHLTITDVSQFTSFATFLLHSPSFEWTISTSKLRVTALGTTFDGVSLSKTVSFKAFDNLPGVTISNFNLPSDDPVGGIHIETDAVIPSPAQLGIDLGTATFSAYYQNTFVGPLAASHLFLAASSSTRTHLSGRIVPQSGGDLDTIGKLFSAFLAGENSTLVTKGDSVQPDGSNGQVSWLSAAFKTLELQVILPGQKFEIIQSISLSDLAVTMQSQDQAFAPPSSSNNTLAVYKNPFGFSLQVTAASEDITISGHGVDIAKLELPMAPANGGVSTGQPVDLQISWHDQPLASLNNPAFEALFAEITLKSNADLSLDGSADVVARTTIGDIPISGIPFNVSSNLAGINSFGGTTILSHVSIVGSGGNGGSEFILGKLQAELNNPSNVSLETVDISLPAIFQDVMIGRAVIDPFNLVPGDNVMPAEFHYEPSNANDTIAQNFLSTFIRTGDQIPLSIKGDADSSPFPSLDLALEGLALSTHVQGLNAPNIITHIYVTITLDTLVTNLVSITFDVFNPLDTEISIEFVQSDAGVNGQTYAQFSTPISGFTIPAGKIVNSGEIDNVVLTQGAIASLAIIPLGYLDIQTASTVRVGAGGYQIPWLKIAENTVPTTYNLELSLSGLKAAAHSINGTSSTASSRGSSTQSQSNSATTSSSSATAGEATARLSGEETAQRTESEIKTATAIAMTATTIAPRSSDPVTQTNSEALQPSSTTEENSRIP